MQFTPTARNRLSRRRLICSAVLATAALAAVTQPALSQTSSLTKGATMQLTQNWDKTFPKSDKVDHQRVTFTNRYGITLVGDLYLPKDSGDRRLYAIVVSGPFGALKEQSSGLYAQALAERGFATLAFDPSHTGESGGQPRNVASPDINTEDFSAGVDFIGRHAAVDRGRIGILGICGWGGPALNAVAGDKRVKAVAVSTIYDMTRVMLKDYNDSVRPQQRTQNLQQLSRQRWDDAENGAPDYGPVGFASD
ncbi:MAG: alpha/beta hydrolase [Proteobacteria bacterium]|nr:MAG: alpha/beta hydrolase [Pseudomonadota bacterium]